MFSGLLLSAALLSPSADPAAPPSALPEIPIPVVSGDGAKRPPAPLPPTFGTAAQTPMPTPPPRTEGDPVAPPEMVPGYAIVANEPAVTSAKKSLNNPHPGPSYSMWAEVGYSLFMLKNGPNPNVLLNSTFAGGGTTVVVGGANDDFGRANGYRASAGLWLNDCHTLGIGGGLFQVEQRSVLAAASSLGNPTLARPFTDALLTQASRALVAAPGAVSGTFVSRSSSRLSGADLYAIHNLTHDKTTTFDIIFGGRYVDLDESIDLAQTSAPIGGTMLSFGGLTSPAITAVTINDRFRTRNQFWGGIVGLRGEYRLGPAFINGTLRVGLGNNHQTVEIDGSTRASGLNLPAASSGLLAVTGGNNGRTINNRFSVLSEAGANVGVYVSSFARVLVGYDFLYLNNVARPGAQIDPVVNTRLVPSSTNFGALTGIASPVNTGRREDFYVHGIRFGVELQF